MEYFGWNIFMEDKIWENGAYTDGQNWQKQSYDRGFNDAK